MPINYNGNGSDVYTQVTVPSGSYLWIVYRSVNGGSYSFYTLMGAGGGSAGAATLNDSGHAQPVLWTCTQMGIPCSPPSSAVPNDVYAQIVSVNGSSFTLQTETNQPQYRYSNIGSTYYPSVPGISGTVTVAHDDTAAFNNFAVYAATHPNTQLHIPGGTYYVHPADPYGHGSALDADGFFNISIAGDGQGATRIVETNDRGGVQYSHFLWATCGAYGQGGPANHCLTQGGYENSGTGYALNDPVGVGSQTVTLVSAANSTNFSVGEYVMIYNNASGYPADTYGELNKIVSINASSGQLGLAYPTNKMYSASLTYPYSNCSACSATPTIGPVLPQPVATNLTLRDFSFSGPVNFSWFNMIDQFKERDLTITSLQNEMEGISRHRYFYDNTATEDTANNGGGLFPEMAAGSSDVQVVGNSFTSPRYTGGSQLCSEGAANLLWAGNTITLSGLGDNPGGWGGGVAGGGGSCFGMSFEHNLITLSQTSLTTVFAGDETTTGNISGNTINIDNAGKTGSVFQGIGPGGTANTLLAVHGNTWNVNSGSIGQTVTGNAQTVPPYTSTTLASQSGAVSLSTYYGQQTVFTIQMSGNITAVNLGSTRIAGYFFAVAFVQPSSGGPYTLPSGCTATYWGVAIDCTGGKAPVANTAAGSTTTVFLWDDGTNVHQIGVTSTLSTGSLSDWANAGAAVNDVATCQAVSGGACTYWAPAPGGGGGTGVVATVNLTGQTASITNTTAYTVPSGSAGRYRVSCYEVATAAATSATLPGCYIYYTDEDTGAQAKAPNGSTSLLLGAATVGTSTAESVNIGSNSDYNGLTFMAAASSVIGFNTQGYAAGSSGTLAYALHLTIEYLGP
jgi:hypothetical protein